MRLALAFLIGLLVGACSGPSAPPATPSHTSVPSAVEVARRMRAATVIVSTPREDMTALCAGVWVGAAEILTAKHCAPDALPIVVIDDAGEHDAELVAGDTPHDVALLRVVTSAKHDVARLRAAAPVVGEVVYTMGHPVGLFFTFSAGHVSADRTLNGERMLQATAPITKGSSGGGLFDVNGELLGISRSIVQPNAALGIFVHPVHCKAIVGSK